MAASNNERIICSKCGKEKRDLDFFTLKTGEKCDMCKDCLTMYIDNTDPSTFLWILEKFDTPYIEKKWIEMSNKARLKDPANFGPRSVLGTYLRVMRMQQYKNFTYADSDKINFEEKKRMEIAQQRKEMSVDFKTELQKKYDAGEISEAEYNTLNPDNVPDDAAVLGMPQHVTLGSEKEEARIAASLEEEDYQYLTLKWGPFYKPSEWIKMEELYNKYASEYEMNVDREDTLRKICKTSLKMDQALDIGDVLAYKNLSAVYDQLRKSGKFTEAQNKEEQEKYLDSIGELVKLVEREGGIISQLDYNEQFSDDKVDLTLKDMQSYTYNLVKNEMGLGDLIESYIEKLEQQLEDEKTKSSLEEGLVTSEDEEAEYQLEDEEAYAFQDYIENEIEKDANLLLELTGGDKNSS